MHISHACYCSVIPRWPAMFTRPAGNYRASSYRLVSSPRTSDTIVSWLEKKTGPPAIAVADVDAAKAFVEEPEVAIIGFFKDQESETAKAYKEVAGAMDDYKFAITSEDAVFGEYEVDGPKKNSLIRKREVSFNFKKNSKMAQR